MWNKQSITQSMSTVKRLCPLTKSFLASQNIHTHNHIYKIRLQHQKKNISNLIRQALSYIFFVFTKNVKYFKNTRWSTSHSLLYQFYNESGLPTAMLHSKASSKGNLRNDNTYIWNCATTSFGQIEQGAH